MLEVIRNSANLVTPPRQCYLPLGFLSVKWSLISFDSVFLKDKACVSAKFTVSIAFAASHSEE